jgi:murein DD-endopeptidase MepM/ murein hydrolase activator NlpD
MNMRIRLAALPAAVGVIVLGLASLQAPAVAASTPKFLHLPFAAGQKIVIQRAWTTFNPATGRFDLNHHAVDYVLGTRDQPATWKKFDALAAAPGDACGAMTNQGGCYVKAGENMGNRVLIKHKVNGVVYYTFYNHLDSITKGIPLNNKNNTVHVDAGQKIGVVGASNSAGGLLHLHWELLDANLKPIDPYGIYGITDQYPDPRGKNGKLAKAKSYFIDNPPTAFGATPKPSPRPTNSPEVTPAPGASPSPSPQPGATAVPVTPVPGASAPVAGQSVGIATQAPTASPGVVAPTTSGDSGELGLVPAAVGIGAVVVAAVLLGLLLLSRRRKPVLPRDGNWRP